MNAFDPARTRLAQELRHTTPLLSARYDPTGRFLFAGSQDFGIQRWAVGDAPVAPAPAPMPTPAPAGGARPATPPAPAVPKVTLVGHRSWVRSLCFHRNDRKLLSGDYHGKVLVFPYEADAPTPEREIEAHDGWLRAIAMAPDGRTFATCGNDRLVKLWSYPDCRLIRTFAGHEWHVYAVGYHPNGRKLVSGDLHGNLREWDLATGNEVRQFDASLLFRHDTVFRADHGGIRAMAFRADGGQFAVAGITNVTNAFAGIGNPAVLLFDWETGQRRQTLRPAAAFQGTGWGVAYHPSGHILGAGGGSGGALFFWRDDREPAVHTVTVPNNARDLALAPDARRVAVPCFDGVVRVYELLPPA